MANKNWFHETQRLLKGHALLEQKSWLQGFLFEIGKNRSLSKPIDMMTHNDILSVLEDIESLDKFCRYVENLNKSKDEDNDEKIPFVNRLEELDSILRHKKSSIQSKNFIIDAPAGFGKTFFLEELEERFSSSTENDKENSWDHAKVSVKKNSSLRALSKLIEKALNIEIKGKIPIGELGYELSSRLIQKYQNTKAYPQGLVFLVDFEKDYDEKIINPLLVFIDQIRENFQENLSLYQKGEFRFRVIMAGRQLSKSEYFMDFPHSVVRLTVFDYFVVRDTIINYILEFPEKSRDELAAHLLFFTGGHPGWMGEVLSKFKKQRKPRGSFLGLFKGRFWETLFKKYTKDILSLFENTDSDREIFENLCTFRFLNSKLIEVFANYYNQENGTMLDDVQLFVKVKQIKLHEPDETHFWADAIARRIVVIWLRQNKKSKFLEYSRIAQNVCKQLLVEDTRNPEMWFIEYIFQEIQKSTFDLDVKSRQKKLVIFLNDVLPPLVGLYLKRDVSPKNRDHEYKILIEEISNQKRHSEFYFLFNYQFRNVDYDNEPMNMLQKKLGELINIKGVL